MEHTKESLEAIIKECNNMSDLCRKLGIKPKGGGYYVARKLIEKYELDVNHFSRQPWNKGIKYRTKENRIRTMDEVLTENSRIESYQLKKRLFNNGYKEKKCESCKNTEWMGKPIKLELHHINGNHFDNRLENLQILCPNCHSYTNTFRGKNQGRYIEKDESELCQPLTDKEIIERYEQKKEKRRMGESKVSEYERRKCLMCGKWFLVKKNRNQKYCSNECAVKSTSRKPTKDTLEKDIREIGYNLTKIGKKYGVSDGAVRKWVKSYGLYKKFEYQSNLGNRIGKYSLDGKEMITIYNSLTSLIREEHHKFKLTQLKDKNGVIYKDFVYKTIILNDK